VGDGIVRFTVAPNSTSRARSGSVRIGDQTLKASQEPALTIGGAGAGKTVTASVDTSLHDELTLLLSQQATNAQGSIYISFEAPSIWYLSDYLWFRPSPLHTPPYLVLVRDASGFFDDASSHYYYRGSLNPFADDASFLIGSIQDLTGHRFVFKSWSATSGSFFDPSNMTLIQSVDISFF
jgi:hypothetical protein